MRLLCSCLILKKLKKATGLLCVDFQVPTVVLASTLLDERFNADDFSITDVEPAYENSWLLKKNWAKMASKQGA